MGKYLLIAAIALLFTLDASFAHQRWVYPTPRSEDTGNKGPYPCGPYPFWSGSTPKTTLSPGVQTLHWEEVINHIGAPFRMALSIGDDCNYDNVVLLDHIPHNDNGGGSTTTPKPYLWNVTIPDINCPKCALQMLCMMTDKITTGTCCPYPFGDSNEICFSVYHSCADVTITGSMDPDVFLASYKNPGPTGQYTQESGTWTQRNGGWWLDSYTPFNPATCPAYNPQIPTNCTAYQSSTGSSTGAPTSNTMGQTSGFHKATIAAFAVFGLVAAVTSL